jgi:hypothetical protein
MLNMTIYLSGKAFEVEHKRWGIQVNETGDKPFEVFRESDDGAHVVVESLRYRQDAVDALDAARAQASTRALLIALADKAQT